MINHDTVKRIERALRCSSIEGMAYGVVQGAGEHFTPAYAVALGASNTQLAFLSSFPTFLGAFGQSFAARLADLLGGRKRVVVAFAALQGLMWLPIVSVGFLFPAHRPELLIAFLALYTLFGGFISPTWGSIMAEVVPEQLRGRYFSLRSRWSTLANMFAFLVGGGLLFVLTDKGPLGFALIFAVAFIFRMVSLGLLTTLFEPHHDGKSDEVPSLRTFVSQLPRTNLGKTFLYLFGVNFVVNLAGPFFAPYMLRELKMDYLTYTVLDTLSIVATVWAVTHWGAAADRVGNRKLLAATGILISLVPLVWLVSGNVFYLAVVELFTGFAWAGFNLVSTNFVYDATSAHNRTAYLAYYSAGASIASGLGALAGGLLIPYVPAFMGSTILTMFILSGALRLLVALVFVPRIQEVRRVRQIPATELFHILLGGRSVHQPASHGRAHHHLQSHGENSGHGGTARPDAHKAPL